jgi:protein gp37
MSDKTGIAWTDATWNPVRGCSRVSEGCRNCYAERVAVRFSGPGQPYEGFADVPEGKRHSQTGAATTGVRGNWTGKVALVEKQLPIAMRWKKPRKIFVNSMSDLFHESLSFETIDKVFAVMTMAPQHTFQVLTKRPKIMQDYMIELLAGKRQVASRAREMAGSIVGGLIALGAMREGERLVPPTNVWLGVSVEDQKTADERIPILLRTPAWKRFVSYEPALGRVDFSPWVCSDVAGVGCGSAVVSNRLDWIIVGGESGQGARPFNVDWARTTVEQCREAKVACFVKQFGPRPFDHPRRAGLSIKDPGHMRLRSSKGDDPSEWPPEFRVQEFPR